MRTYSELIQIPSYIERFNYLRLDGSVGTETFGFDRYLNQDFYKSRRWKQLRDRIIVRDDGCDIAHPDVPINGKIIIHHMNPILPRDIVDNLDAVLDPENLVCVSFMTHQAIHYGDESLIFTGMIERSSNDTCPWRKEC